MKRVRAIFLPILRVPNTELVVAAMFERAIEATAFDPERRE